MNERIAQLMKSLGVTEQEAHEIIADDERIDKGEKLFELSTEQKQVVKKMSSTGTRAPTVYQFTKRERKADNDKRAIIARLADAVAEIGDNIEVTNIEREIVFYCNGRKLKIVLSAPRT